MDGGKRHKNARFLRRVRTPRVVTVNEEPKILAQDGAMQRANHLNIQRGSLLQQSLHLATVLAHNVEVIATSFAAPVVHLRVIRLFMAYRTKLTKAIRAEQNLLSSLIAHHNLGPVNHRSRIEGQRMLAKLQHIALFNHLDLIGNAALIKLRNHLGSTSTANHHSRGVLRTEGSNVCRMIRLHVVHNQVIRSALTKHLSQVRKPLLGATCINGVKNSNLLVQNHIRVVRHAFFKHVLTLKNIQVQVVATNVLNCVANHQVVHLNLPCKQSLQRSFNGSQEVRIFLNRGVIRIIRLNALSGAEQETGLACLNHP